MFARLRKNSLELTDTGGRKDESGHPRQPAPHAPGVAKLLDVAGAMAVQIGCAGEGGHSGDEHGKERPNPFHRCRTNVWRGVDIAPFQNVAMRCSTSSIT